MRLTLTVVDPFGGDSADVVLDADPESTVGDIAQELAKQVGDIGAQVIPIGQQGRTGGSPLVYVDGYAVDAEATVVGSPLRDGAVVSLQDPAGCLPGEPTGLVELRVVGGNEAITTSVGLAYRPAALRGLEVSVQVDNAWDTDFQEVPAVPASPRQFSAGVSYVW